MIENKYERKTTFFSLLTFLSTFYLLGFTLMAIFDGVNFIYSIGAVISIFTAYFSIYLKKNKTKEYIDIKLQIASLISFIAFISIYTYDKIYELLFNKVSKARFVLNIIFIVAIILVIIYIVIKFIKTKNIYEAFK